MALRLGKLVLAVFIAFGTAGVMSRSIPLTTAFAQATETATSTSTATSTATATSVAATATAPASTELTIVTSELPDADLGQGYFTNLFAMGGTAPYTWTITNGTPPPGITISTQGAVSGTPTFPGVLTFTMRVQDAAGATKSATLTMTVIASTFISTVALPNGQVGLAYSATLTAVGGTLPYTWIVSSGALPPGLGLSASGTITGTPTAAGTTSFTVQMTDAVAVQVTQPLSIVVGATVVIDTAELPSGTVDTAYSATLSASGGNAAYTWTVASGALPAGLTLDSSGTLSGTPTSTGAAAFTVQATDALAVSASRAFTMTVASHTGTISSGNIPSVGFGIIVFSGGSVSELVAAANCAQQTLAFWATIEGSFIGYVPNTTIGAVNAQFLSIFQGGVLPSNTPLVARC